MKVGELVKGSEQIDGAGGHELSEVASGICLTPTNTECIEGG